MRDALLTLFLLICLCRAQIPPEVPRFELLELSIRVPSPDDAPFNTSSLETWVEVTEPGGILTTCRPFLKQNFSREQDPSGNEIVKPQGAPFFAVRFAPTMFGLHVLKQRFSAGANVTGIVPLNGSFVCTAPLRVDGFASVDPAYRQYFTLDGGQTAHWLVGENMGWAGVWPYFNGSARWSNGTGGTYMYDRYLGRLAAAGGNWVRLWLGPSLITEPTWDSELGSFLGMSLMGQVPFGTYNLAAAWRVDYVVELARSLGIKITVVLDAQQACCTPG